MRIDTHCHLDCSDYDDLDHVILNMENNIMIDVGTNIKTNQGVLNLCQTYKNIYGAIGIHPEEVDQVDESSFEWIEQHILDPKIVAIGEIGLDYYYTKENKEKQKEIFIRQIELAKQYQKAIIVHSREAISDTYMILMQYAIGIPVVLHAYSSSIEMARKFIKLGYFLGIGGVVTFKNGTRLQEVVKGIPLQYLLLETDSPYLTPDPYRGRRNEPSNVKYVSEKIADIKGISVEEVEKITTNTAVQLFDLSV